MSSGTRFTQQWLQGAAASSGGATATAGSAGAGSSSAGGASSSFGSSFSTLFGGSAGGGSGSGSSSGSGNDVESSRGGGDADGGGETSSFLPSFVRNTGLFSSGPAPPPEWACGMSLAQRMQVGSVLLLGAAFLFAVALFVFLPMVLLFPAKFAAAFSVGSLLLMAAMALFRGPRTTLLGFLERERLAFSAAYLGSLALTLYAALAGQSYFLVVFAVAVQVAALLWYASTFVPGGTTGMGFMSRMLLASAASSARGVAGMAVGGGR
jgi:hypothetical protein